MELTVLERCTEGGNLHCRSRVVNNEAGIKIRSPLAPERHQFMALHGWVEARPNQYSLGQPFPAAASKEPHRNSNEGSCNDAADLFCKRLAAVSYSPLHPRWPPHCCGSESESELELESKSESDSGSEWESGPMSKWESNQWFQSFHYY